MDHKKMQIEDKILCVSFTLEEVKNAQLFYCIVCIEMDPNGKVGWNVILRHIKGNFYLILLKETIFNASDFCEKNHNK